MLNGEVRHLRVRRVEGCHEVGKLAHVGLHVLGLLHNRGVVARARDDEKAVALHASVGVPPKQLAHIDRCGAAFAARLGKGRRLERIADVVEEEVRRSRREDEHGRGHVRRLQPVREVGDRTVAAREHDAVKGCSVGNGVGGLEPLTEVAHDDLVAGLRKRMHERVDLV